MKIRPLLGDHIFVLFYLRYQNGTIFALSSMTTKLFFINISIIKLILRQKKKNSPYANNKIFI